MRMPDIASRIKQWSCNCDVTWPLCNVEGSDPYHSAQQVHREESYLDESNKKILSFQGLREMQVHKKIATGPYFEPHGSSPHIYTTSLKNDFHIILQAMAMFPMCNFFPSFSVPTVLNIMFVSPLMNLFATCLMILRMLEHNKHGFLFVQSVW